MLTISARAPVEGGVSWRAPARCRHSSPRKSETPSADARHRLRGVEYRGESFWRACGTHGGSRGGRPLRRSQDRGCGAPESVRRRDGHVGPHIARPIPRSGPSLAVDPAETPPGQAAPDGAHFEVGASRHETKCAHPARDLAVPSAVRFGDGVPRRRSAAQYESREPAPRQADGATRLREAPSDVAFRHRRPECFGERRRATLSSHRNRRPGPAPH